MKKTLLIIVLVLALMVSTAVVAFAADSTVYLYSNEYSKNSSSISSISAQSYGYSYTDATVGTTMILMCNYDGSYHGMGDTYFNPGSSGRNPVRSYDIYTHPWRVRLLGGRIGLELGAHSFGTVYN